MRVARYYELAHIGVEAREVELIRANGAIGFGAGAAFAALGRDVTPPAARADDFGLGDVVSDLIASASSAEVGSQGVDQALAATASGAETLSAAGLFQQYIYDPLHASAENWINSSFGEQVDNAINTASGQFLIGNGVDGTADGSQRRRRRVVVRRRRQRLGQR